PRDRAADRVVLGRPGRSDLAAVCLADGGRSLPRRGVAARSGLHPARVAPAARDDAGARAGPLPLLACVPRRPLRRACDRPAARMTGPELERKNMILGLALFGLFLLIFGATVLVAFIYLALDCPSVGSGSPACS